MDILERNLTIAMARELFEDIPQPSLPQGYAVRWFRPGDEETWLSIQRAADAYNEFDDQRFVREFGRDPERLAARQCYLQAPRGEVVGTATAWWGQAIGEEVGRVHWVAIVPEYQGRGLAKPLLSAVCGRLQELGHTSLFLTTSTVRTIAIRLYLQYGFEALVRTPQEADAWDELQSYLQDRRGDVV